MTRPPVPPQALRDATAAAEASLRTYLEPWLPAEAHGTTLDSQIRTAAGLAVREAAPHLAGHYQDAAYATGVTDGAAAERERLRAEVPTGVIRFEGGKLSEADLAELAERWKAAWRKGDYEILPSVRLGTWRIELEGGPAFAANAAMACRLVAAKAERGPAQEALDRLAAALDHAEYGGEVSEAALLREAP